MILAHDAPVSNAKKSATQFCPSRLFFLYGLQRIIVCRESKMTVSTAKARSHVYFSGVWVRYVPWRVIAVEIKSFNINFELYRTEQTFPKSSNLLPSLNCIWTASLKWCKFLNLGTKANLILWLIRVRMSQTNIRTVCQPLREPHVLNLWKLAWNSSINGRRKFRCYTRAVGPKKLRDGDRNCWGPKTNSIENIRAV